MRQKSKVRQPKVSGCFLYGFFGIFAVAGSATFYFFALAPIFSIVKAWSWERTTCVIESSQVASRRGGSSTTYWVDIRYTYQAELGETFHGNRYDFSPGSSSGYAGKARIVEAHWPGNEVDCYFDPKHPDQSVINRSLGPFLWWGLFPLPFLAIGFGGPYLLFSRGNETRRKVSKRHQNRSSDSRVGPSAVPRIATPMASGGRLKLEPGNSPTTRVMGAILGAVVWNGIVTIALFKTILPSFRQGDPEWFGTFFMIPFALIGLVLIVNVFYRLLASFNPRLDLTLANSRLTPGAESLLEWRFSGRAARIQKLTLELEGREQATYRRGTSTSTDHHVFLSRQLESRARPFETIDRGYTPLEIPSRTMPTFESRNNKIEWRIKVHGEIASWPDVKEVFPIVIRPGGDS